MRLLLSRLFFLLFLASLVLMVWGWVMDKRTMPTPDQLLPVLQQEPIQKQVNMAALTQTREGHTYYIQPLYTYELYGLVVSKHIANSSFSNRAHEQWGDFLNTMDICVLWGENALSGIYQDLEFSSGQWTCFFETKKGKEDSWRDFDLTGIGNNHILPNSEAMAKTLKNVRIGDQIRFKGYLAEYGTNGRLIRGTSTTRTDTGQGACETVYVEDLEILKPVDRHWGQISRYAMWASLLTFILWAFGFFMPEHAKEDEKITSERAGLRKRSAEKSGQHPRNRVEQSGSQKNVNAQVSSGANQKYFVMHQGVQENEGAHETPNSSNDKSV